MTCSMVGVGVVLLATFAVSGSGVRSGMAGLLLSSASVGLACVYMNMLCVAVEIGCI